MRTPREDAEAEAMRPDEYRPDPVTGQQDAAKTHDYHLSDRAPAVLFEAVKDALVRLSLASGDESVTNQSATEISRAVLAVLPQQGEPPQDVHYYLCTTHGRNWIEHDGAVFGAPCDDVEKCRPGANHSVYSRKDGRQAAQQGEPTPNSSRSVQGFGDGQQGEPDEALREALERIERGSVEAANNAPPPWREVFELAANVARGALTRTPDYAAICQEVSRRHPGCTFPPDEVRAVIEDANESTGVPAADAEIRRLAAARENPKGASR